MIWLMLVLAAEYAFIGFAVAACDHLKRGDDFMEAIKRAWLWPTRVRIVS